MKDVGTNRLVALIGSALRLKKSNPFPIVYGYSKQDFTFLRDVPGGEMTRLLLAVFAAIAFLENSAFAEWSRVSGPRGSVVSGPRGSSVSGSRDARRMNRDERDILENSSCVWVDSANDEVDELRDIVGYEVPNCQDPETGGPSIVCSGMARCNVQFPSDGKRTVFTLYVDNVMCRSRFRRSCPTAGDCLLQGGALSNFSIEGEGGELPQQNDWIRYSPSKQPVRGKTH